MTSTNHTSTSSSNFQSILENALRDYTKETGVDLAKYDFAKRLERCNSSDEILWLLREKAKKFKEYREKNRKLINWITPVVQVVHAFAGALAEASSLIVFPYSPAKAIIIGIDVLLEAAKDVSSSYDALVELFEHVGSFLRRLNIYTEMPLNDALMHILVNIMKEVLSVLALATKQIKQGRFKKFAKKLLGESEIEDVLQRLDRLTQEEAQMTVAQTLEIVHGLVNNVKLVMEDGKISMDGIRQALVSMQAIAGDVHKIRRDQLQGKVRNWLDPPNPSTNHYDVYDAYQQGTAAWFLQGRVFAKWKATGSLLWVHGKPGSGKSVLLSSIIHALDDERAAGLASVAYYYFDFRDSRKQDRQGLLTSILVQLCAESDPFYDTLSRLYSAHAHGTRKPTDGVLTQCLKDILERQGQAAIYVIVDAIDECPNTSGLPTARDKVLQLVEWLVDLQLPKLHICVASRPEVDIRDVLEPLTPLQVSLHDELGQRQDIVDYVTRVVRTDRQMLKWREEDKELVIRVLPEKSEGMFRWAFCQLECLRRHFPASIRSALDGLPTGLDETYERILLNIDEEKWEFAQRLFQCLAVSVRPFRVDELAEVLAIRFNSDPLPNYNVNWRSEDAKEAVLSACSGLITVAKADGSPVVQFSHFSVKEFLTSGRLASMQPNASRYHILANPAHTILAKACLSILLKLDYRVDRKAIENSPLALYAARHWVEHAQFEGVSSQIQGTTKVLFDSSKPHFATWIWLYDMDNHWKKQMVTPRPTQPPTRPLYYAAMCGFYDAVKHLVHAYPSDINAMGGHHITALCASLARGHKDVTSLLLQHDANVDVGDSEGATPLHKACRSGNLDVVQLLLDHDAKIHARTKRQESSLHFAASEGEVEVCRLLLEHGADINCKDDQGWTVLHSASRYGHVQVVDMLLDRGVDVDTTKKDAWTPLHLAAANGKLEIAQLLIKRGAAIDKQNDSQESALDRAVSNGDLDIVQLLLTSRARVDVPDKQGFTPLHTAARNGCREIVELLLRSGASLDVQTESRKTPLALACGSGRLDVSIFLIDRGADMNTQDAEGWSPLHSASRHGHVDVVRLLLKRGADVNARKADNWTPLHLAVANGYPKVVTLLLQYHADVDSKNAKQETPLDRAAGNGYLEIARILIEHGASVLSRDNKGWTPFHTASKSGHLHVAKLLLERGVNVDVRNGGEETSLDLASSRGKLEVVRFLIEQGTDVHAKDNKGWNPLHVASQNGHLEVVRLLVSAGVDLDTRNGTQKTPLILASSKGKVEVARFLLKRGADMNARDMHSWAPLHLAARHGHVEMTRLLLDHGVDANTQKDDRWSALHLASANGHVNVARPLVECGAKVNVFNNKRETPLDRAARSGNVEVTRLLIDKGADLYATDSNGWSPLHTASQSGHLEVVKLLLRRGADIEAVNTANQTAAKLASENGKGEVASFFAEYKADANVRNNVRSSTLDTNAHSSDEVETREIEEKTPLHTASEEGKLEVVRALLEKGAHVNAQKRSNLKTPLDLAATNGHLEVVNLLLERGAEVDSRDRFGWTPLHKASRYGHLEISRVLVDRGADVNARKQDHWTPVHLAARNGHIAVVALLIDRGANVTVVNDESRTPLQLSIGKGYRDIAELIREHETRGT